VSATLQQITGPGQLSVGDRIIIENKSGERQKARVKIVLDKETEIEEIVINKSRNHYFIVSMLMAGSSWVKECHKVIEQQAVKDQSNG
jgi:hypothetical protein